MLCTRNNLGTLKKNRAKKESHTLTSQLKKVLHKMAVLEGRVWKGTWAYWYQEIDIGRGITAKILYVSTQL